MNMKKTLAALLCLTLALPFAGCESAVETGNEPEDEGFAGLANPMVGYESLDEINGIAGTNIVHPGIMGVTDEAFFVINGGASAPIAQYDYKAAGYEFSLRGAKTGEDFSGLYADGASLFGECEEDADLEIAAYDGGRAGRWSKDGVQYVFYAKGNIEEEQFRGICEETVALTSVSFGKCPALGGLDGEKVECASLDELNEKIGCHIVKPGVMGVTDESFAVIGADTDVAEYAFTAAGRAFTVRAAKTADDISGISGEDGESLFEGAAGAEYESESICTESAYVCRFVDGEMQYVISTADVEDYDSETFSGIADELRTQFLDKMTAEEKAAYYEEFTGSYQDVISGRAVLDASYSEELGRLSIGISWADSASAAMNWKMSAASDRDGDLAYKDCTKSYATYDEDGNATEEVLYEDGEGYFTLQDGCIIWSFCDDADGNTKLCVFKPIGE